MFIYISLESLDKLQVHIDGGLTYPRVVFLDEIVDNLACDSKWEFNRKCIFFIK